MEAIVTEHAKDRLKERSGLKKKSIDRIAEKALTEGYSHNELKGRLKKFVDALYLSHNVCNNIKIYGDKAYLFKGTTLITVLQVPNYLTKDIKNMVKRKE